MGTASPTKRQSVITLLRLRCVISFIDDAANAQLVKSNTYRYRKDRKEKSLRSKRSSKMRGVIRRLEDQGHTPTELPPMIHMARAMEVSSDTDYSDTVDSDDSGSE